jgi:hypothetical protein
MQYKKILARPFSLTQWLKIFKKNYSPMVRLKLKVDFRESLLEVHCHNG